MAKADVMQVFCTEIQRIDWALVKRDGDDYARPHNLNDRMTAELWKKRALNPEGVYRSNMSGTWHSKDDVLQTTGSAGVELGKMFHQASLKYAQRFVTQPGGELTLRHAAWAMMYSDRGYATAHTHPNCHFSHVYYVDTGEPAETQVMATGVSVTPGDIEFIDTRGGPGATQVPGLALQTAARISPKSGHLLSFPSWLPHFVHPVQGDHVRIAIACNTTILKYTPPKEA